MIETIGLTTFSDELFDKKDNNQDLYFGRFRVHDFYSINILRNIKYKRMLKKNFIIFDNNTVIFNGSLTDSEVKNLKFSRSNLAIKYYVDPYGGVRTIVGAQNLGKYLKDNNIDLNLFIKTASELFCPVFNSSIAKVNLVHTNSITSDYFYFNVDYNYNYGENGFTVFSMIFEVALFLAIICIKSFNKNMDEMIRFIKEEFSVDPKVTLLSYYGPSHLIGSDTIANLIKLKKVERSTKLSKKYSVNMKIVTLGNEIKLAKEAHNG